MSRMTAHTRALMGVLPAGLARGHRGNPAAALRIELLYGCPVLLSGLAALVLNKAEIDIIHHHYKINLERLQRLHKATPEPVVCFLGGNLPLTAHHHLNQLTLLGMIARLGPNHILHRIGCSILSSPKPFFRSWFHQLKIISAQYSLPDPLTVLTCPPSKTSYKNQVKSKVIDYWETKLRLKASKLDSLAFFQAQFYSLSHPHPIWTSAGGNSYEVEKACVQAKMLSGRYRTCWLSRHWSENSSGICSLPSCRLAPTPGTLPHILTECQDLMPARIRVFTLWSEFLKDNLHLLPVVKKYCVDCHPTSHLQFLLNCTVLPEVISLSQIHGKTVHDSLLYLTRTYCYSMHKARLKLLGKWNLK